jgi:hypothetical protein
MQKILLLVATFAAVAITPFTLLAQGDDGPCKLSNSDGIQCKPCEVSKSSTVKTDLGIEGSLVLETQFPLFGNRSFNWASDVTQGLGNASPVVSQSCLCSNCESNCTCEQCGCFDCGCTQCIAFAGGFVFTPDGLPDSVSKHLTDVNFEVDSIAVVTADATIEKPMVFASPAGFVIPNTAEPGCCELRNATPACASDCKPCSTAQASQACCKSAGNSGCEKAGCAANPVCSENVSLYPGTDWNLEACCQSLATNLTDNTCRIDEQKKSHVALGPIQVDPSPASHGRFVGVTLSMTYECPNAESCNSDSPHPSCTGQGCPSLQGTQDRQIVTACGHYVCDGDICRYVEDDVNITAAPVCNPSALPRTATRIQTLSVNEQAPPLPPAPPVQTKMLSSPASLPRDQFGHAEYQPLGIDPAMVKHFVAEVQIPKPAKSQAASSDLIAMPRDELLSLVAEHASADARSQMLSEIREMQAEFFEAHIALVAENAALAVSAEVYDELYKIRESANEELKALLMSNSELKSQCAMLEKQNAWYQSVSAKQPSTTAQSVDVASSKMLQMNQQLTQEVFALRAQNAQLIYQNNTRYATHAQPVGGDVRRPVPFAMSSFDMPQTAMPASSCAIEGCGQSHCENTKCRAALIQVHAVSAKKAAPADTKSPCCGKTDCCSNCEDETCCQSAVCCKPEGDCCKASQQKAETKTAGVVVPTELKTAAANASAPTASKSGSVKTAVLKSQTKNQ